MEDAEQHGHISENSQVTLQKWKENYSELSLYLRTGHRWSAQSSSFRGIHYLLNKTRKFLPGILRLFFCICYVW